MKTVLMILAAILLGTTVFAEEQPIYSVNMYEEIIKVEYKSSKQVLSLNFQGVDYSWGLFDSDKFMEKVSYDRPATELFQKSRNGQASALISGVSFLGLFVGGIGLEAYAKAQPQDRNGNNPEGWAAVGLIAGSLVTEFIFFSFENSATQNFFEAVNKFNSDVLSPK